MSVNKQRKGAFGTEWFIISKKTIYKVIGALLALVLLVGIGFAVKHYIETWEGSSLDQSHSARFLRIDGKVTIKRAATGAAVQATQDMSLEPGDTIQTSSDATALVEYEDGSRYTIKPGSTIILKENFKNATRVVSKLEVGKVKVITQEKSGKHIVDTPAGAKTEFGPSSDIGIDMKDGKATVVVGRGLATIFTSQGEQKLAANQRIDVSSEGVKRSELLPPPELGTPENAKQMLLEQTDEIEFVWKPVAEADNYKLTISPSISFPEQALTVNIAGLGDTKYRWRKPVAGNYFWHVQAISKDGVEGNWSDPANFSIRFKRTGGADLLLRITKTNEINFFLVEIEGVTKPGTMLTVNEHATEVDAKGSFKYAVTFPPNTRERTITLEAQDANGNTKTVVQKL